MQVHDLVVIRSHELLRVQNLLQDCIDTLRVMFRTNRFNVQNAWNVITSAISELNKLKLDPLTVIQFADGVQESVQNLFQGELDALMELGAGTDAIRDMITSGIHLQQKRLELLKQLGQMEGELLVADHCLERERTRLSQLSKEVQARMTDHVTPADKSDIEFIVARRKEIDAIDIKLMPQYMKETPVLILGMKLFTRREVVPGTDPGLQAQKDHLLRAITEREQAYLRRRDTHRGQLQQLELLQDAVDVLMRERETIIRAMRQPNSALVDAEQDLKVLAARRQVLEQRSGEPLAALQSISEAATVLESLVDTTKLESIPVFNTVFAEAKSAVNGLLEWSRGFEAEDVPFLEQQLAKLEKARDLVNMVQFHQQV